MVLGKTIKAIRIKITEWHEKLLLWKPIHLCWWFEKHNLPIPKYFIGKGTPILTTNACDNIGINSCDGNGTIDSVGAGYSEGDVTRRGFCWVVGSGGAPDTGDDVVYEDGSFGTGSYSLAIEGLDAETTYSVRAYAVNATGTGYGSTVEVTTIGSPSISESASPSPSVSPSTSESSSESASPSPSTSESVSPSPSVSESASPSPSTSESTSPSPSVSPSTSQSTSPSPSTSESDSPSISPSTSESSSPSPSVSPSVSESASPSAGYQLYTRDTLASLPSDDADLTYPYSTSDEEDVSSKNNVWVVQPTVAGEYAIHQFKDWIGAGKQCNLEWEGQSVIAPSSAIVKLQVYNQDTPAWEDVDSDNSTGADTDFTLTGDIPDTTDYVDGSGIISCRVYQQVPE